LEIHKYIKKEISTKNEILILEQIHFLFKLLEKSESIRNQTITMDKKRKLYFKIVLIYQMQLWKKLKTIKMLLIVLKKEEEKTK